MLACFARGKTRTLEGGDEKKKKEKGKNIGVSRFVLECCMLKNTVNMFENIVTFVFQYN